MNLADHGSGGCYNDTCVVAALIELAVCFPVRLTGSVNVVDKPFCRVSVQQTIPRFPLHRRSASTAGVAMCLLRESLYVCHSED